MQSTITITIENASVTISKYMPGKVLSIADVRVVLIKALISLGYDRHSAERLFSEYTGGAPDTELDTEPDPEKEKPVMRDEVRDMIRDYMSGMGDMLFEVKR